MALIGSVSGSHTKLADGTTYIEAGSNITIASGSGNSITITGTNTTYTAGDGLDLSGTAFSTDLKSGGGLKIDATELAVEVNDFAGTGLEDDGSDNLRISSAAAGNGLTGGAGSALAVGAGTGISVASTVVGVDNTVVATLSGSQFSGNVGVTGSISASGQLSGSSVFVDIISGSLTTLTDGRPLILGGGATSVSSGSPDKPGQITISSVDTNYTAGDGLDLSGTSFSTDLKTAGGLEIDSTELAIDNSVVATVSGSTFTGAVKFNSGLSGSLTHLADGSPLIIGGANITVSSASGENITIAGSGDTTYTAGNGLDLSGTTFSTDLKAGSGLVIDSTELSIDHSIIPATSGAIFSGDVGITGSLSTTGRAEVDRLEVGGGFGSTGVSITSAGAIMMNSSIKVAGGAIQDSAGNNNILISGGNTQITGDLTANTGIKISSNALTASDGGKPIIWDTDDNVTIAGGLKISNNAITSSAGNAYPLVWDSTGNIINDVTFKSVAGGTTFPTISLESTDLSANDSSELRFKKYDTAIADNSLMGEIYFMAGEVEGSYYSAAGIAGSCDGNWIDGSSRPGKLNFYTTGENSTSITSRMTINEHGDVDLVKNLYVAGNIFASGSIGGSIDTTNLTLSGDLAVNGGEITCTGTLTLDVVTDIILDAGGANVTVKDGGVTTLDIVSNGTTNVTLDAPGDIILDASGGQTYFSVDGANGAFIEGDATPRLYFYNSGAVYGATDLRIESVAGDVYIEAGDDIFNSLGATDRIYFGAGSSTYDHYFDNCNRSGADTSNALVIGGNTGLSSAQGNRGLRLNWYTAAASTYITNGLYIQRGYDTTNDNSAYRIQADGSGGSTYSNTFTAGHDTSCQYHERMLPGMIVESTGEEFVDLDDKFHIALPRTRVCTIDGSKNVFGVITADRKPEYDGEGNLIPYDVGDEIQEFGPEYVVNGWWMTPAVKAYGNGRVGEDEHHIATYGLGDSNIWVTNINGNLESGDLVESSVVGGYGRKQDDDIIRSKTIGKLTVTPDWDNITDTVEHDGQTYKKCLAVALLYCG